MDLVLLAAASRPAWHGLALPAGLAVPTESWHLGHMQDKWEETVIKMRNGKNEADVSQKIKDPDGEVMPSCSAPERLPLLLCWAPLCLPSSNTCAPCLRAMGPAPGLPSLLVGAWHQNSLFSHPGTDLLQTHCVPLRQPLGPAQLDPKRKKLLQQPSLAGALFPCFCPHFSYRTEKERGAPPRG